MEKKYITKTVAETEAVAKELAQILKKGDIVALVGELGAGKTVFARGILKGFGYFGIVASPTFTIAAEYFLEGIKLVHYDLYRIDDEHMLEETGFYSYIDEQAILLIEWGDRVKSVLDDCFIRVFISGSGLDPRSITIETGEAE